MRKNIYHRLITALFLIVIGTVLLLNNLHLLPFVLPAYIFTWQMALIVLGVFFLLRLKVFPGIILLGLGMYFIAPIALRLPQEKIEAFWPALLILFGIAVFLKGFEDSRKKKHWKKIIKRETAEFNNTVIFGGESKKVSSYDFKGGKLVAIFGGLEIDLTNCTLNKENNVVEVVAVFGGVTLIVPKEWNVRTDVLPIMGGIEDSGKASEYVDPAAEFFIKGVAILGGLEIKRV